jgi:GT2 family glycosyltransferase
MSFFIGYVHSELVHAAFMESVIREGELTGAIIKGQESEPYVDQARNFLVEQFLVSDREWFLSVDTDVILPERVITRLLARNRKLIGALIYVNAKPPFPQIYQKIADFGVGGFGTYLVDTDWEPGDLIKAGATGAGCMLIHREVFEAVPPNKPFRWFQHEQRGEDLFGEDVVFCERAKRAGHQLYIDTAVKAGHIKPNVI